MCKEFIYMGLVLEIAIFLAKERGFAYTLWFPKWFLI